MLDKWYRLNRYLYQISTNLMISQDDNNQNITIYLSHNVRLLMIYLARDKWHVKRQLVSPVRALLFLA